MAFSGVDLLIVLLIGMGFFRGYQRGLIREVFGFVGALFMVALSYQGYQELSFYLTQRYSMDNLLAQFLAFSVLALSICCICLFVGQVWSYFVQKNFFAFLDHLAGASLGVAKVAVITIVLVALVSSAGFSPWYELLQESTLLRQVFVVLPLLYERVESIWPSDWPKPAFFLPRPKSPLLDRYI